jgi:predicted MFS family arabinose efflux permease
MGIAQSMANLGRVLGPMWGGYSFDAYGVVSPFVTAGLFMALAFLLSRPALRSPAPSGSELGLG